MVLGDMQVIGSLTKRLGKVIWYTLMVASTEDTLLMVLRMGKAFIFGQKSPKMVKLTTFILENGKMV